MNVKLTHNAYGKSRVRLTKVLRPPRSPSHGRHDVLEMAVSISLEGDFAASYTAGDNRNIIATDSQKNTVYVLARETEFDCIDVFAVTLARHFVDTYPQVDAADVAIEQTLFDRIPVSGEPHAHAFTGGRVERRTARCRVARGGEVQRWGGIAGLVVLKSAGSEFHGFVDDRYRTLPDTTERIFATTVDAAWSFDNGEHDPADATDTYDAIRPALLTTFATHHSLAVQQTLLEMGRAALDASPMITKIDLSMPNQHRIPFDLGPFGLDNPAMVFVPTDEPAGQITGTVERS